jgi:hypothetical protein
MQHLLAGLAVAGTFALGVASTPAAPNGTRVLTFDDPAIVEASDLVVTDGLFVTTNDSGDTGQVFVVDHDGRTVGLTRWSNAPTDVEALAPAGPGAVWVGDIGDNEGRRSSVSIARVPVGRGDRDVHPMTYHLSYPDGGTDAETLMRDPVTGRLYIATKNVFGGILYAVPEHLDPSATNPLKAVGRVIPIATDGAFFPDGKHLIVRDYTSAVVYAWPSLQPVGSFDLPAQRQGEGIAVATDGSVYLSSEGPRSTVLRVTLPPKVTRAVAGEVAASPSGPASATATPSGSNADAPVSGRVTDPAETEPTGRDAWPWLLGGLLGVVALVVLLRALRPR